MDTVDKYLITEKKTNIFKTLRFWKDVLIIIQDIYDIKSERLSPDEKQKKIDKNIELIRYLLKKNRVEPLYRDMIAAGTEVALKHVGVRNQRIS